MVNLLVPKRSEQFRYKSAIDQAKARKSSDRSSLNRSFTLEAPMMGPGPGIMEDENFCLRWNDYEKKYAETFRTLREDDHFAGMSFILQVCRLFCRFVI